MAITPHNRATEAMDLIIETVISVLEIWLALPENPNPEKQGGYLAVFDHHGHLAFACRIGQVPDDKADKYFTLAIEKGRRLISHYDHSSSWQSRNPQARLGGQSASAKPWGQWGGAIRLHNGWIFSFSGLPELGDESLMLVSGVKIGWLDYGSSPTRPSAAMIATLSDNHLYSPLYIAAHS